MANKFDALRAMLLGDDLQREKLDELGLVPLPPERKMPDYSPKSDAAAMPTRPTPDEESGLDAASLQRPDEPPSIDPLPTTAYIDQGSKKQMWAPTRAMALQLLERSKNRHRPDAVTADGQPVEVDRQATEVSKPTTKGDRLALLAAIERVGESSQGQQGEPLANTAESSSSTDPQLTAQPSETKRRPLGVVGPAELPARPNADATAAFDENSFDAPEYKAELGRPDRRVFGGEPKGGGSPVEQLASKLTMGSTPDPRTAELRAALEKRSSRLGMADGLDTMASGADIAAGTHYNSPGAYMRAAQAQGDADVDQVTAPAAFEQKSRKFESDQTTDAQNRQLHANADVRAGSADARAANEDRRRASDETRKQQGFETQQAETDASSQTSANARAEAEALYPAIKQRIPKEQWETFSASDVKRLFAEVQQKDFAPKPTGASKQSGIDNRQARNMAAKAKLNDPSMVHAMNDVLATLDAGNAPGTGYFMNEGGWQNFLRSPDGQQFRQAMFTVMNPYIHEVHGLNVTDNELERAMAQFGYGSFDDPQTLASGMRRVAEGMEAKQQQRLRQLPPEAQDMLTSQGAVEHVDSKRGKALKGAPEQEFGDSMDFPAWAKPYLGILGQAKQYLSGKKGKPNTSRNLNLDVD